VVSGVALVCGRRPVHWFGHESTQVEFLAFDEPMLRAYVASREPLDKAGAYGIQGLGALMVRRIDGCYFNVMGLPLARLGVGLRAVLASPAPQPAQREKAHE
jgi:septum formation protein